MSKKRRISVLFVLAFFLAVSCKSVPSSDSTSVPSSGKPGSMRLSGKPDSPAEAEVTPSAVSGSGGTPLAVPAKDQLQKNTMDAITLGFLETGSPASIKIAVDRINADSRGMIETNRVALSVAGELMNIVYPLEKVAWPIPAVSDSVSYIGAIRSARMGIYDYNTGNTDFLSLVLPSLVMVLSPSAGDYYNDAEAALKKAAQMKEKSVLPPYFLALLAERRGNSSEAGFFFKKAWELDQSCYPAGIGYAEFLIAGQNGTTALEITRFLLSRYPDAVQMVRLCAEAAFSVQDWNAADPYILQILKSDPNETRYLLMRARILVERKEYLKANSLLDAFATTNRTDKSYLLLRSRVIREWSKNLISAALILQEAERLYPEDIDVLLASAEVSYLSGTTINKRSGREFVQLVLKQSPENRTALILLANDYIASGEWTEAVKTAERLVSLYPVDETRVVLLRAYLGASRNDLSVPLAKKLYGVENPSDEITALYLQSLLDAGDVRTATTVISSRMGDANSSLKSQLYYFQSKVTSNPDGVLSALRSCLLADPRNSAGLYAMYQWYLTKEDFRKAEYYLKQVIALNPGNKKYAQLLSDLETQLVR